MVKSVLLILLSVLALSSAQLSNVPQRARNDNSVVTSSSGQDSAYGRGKSNLRNGASKQRDLQTASMSLPSEEPASAPAEPAYCNNDIPCTEEGYYCSCRFSCNYCSDVPMYHVPDFCGQCLPVAP